MEAIKKDIFIITTYISNVSHEIMLKECIYRIQLFHPESDIIILNDSHSFNLTTMFDSYIRVENTKYERCGEINAYVWACEHKGEYESFCFIHDSVLLINRIHNNSNLTIIGYRPLWYGSTCISDNTQSVEVDVIVSKIRINNKTIFDKLESMRNRKGSIVFGGMGIFNISFLKYLQYNTTFLECAYLFNSRYLRSFFERLLYMLLSEYYNIDNFRVYSLCGDIINHKDHFNHSCILNNTIANNPFLLKVWRGR